MTRKQRHRDYEDCPVEAALDLIGGKWKASILYACSFDSQRFNGLRRLFPKISQRTLTNQLRELEADGLLLRTVFAEVPPRVEYTLTSRSEALLPVLQGLHAWGAAHVLPGADGALSLGA
ncbi:MAG: helix-turn-helix domain-containing protein [Pseudomonadota bacterium]